MAYLLFACDCHDATLGAGDVQGRFETLEAAIAAHDPAKFGAGSWANVMSLDSLSTVATWHNGAWVEGDPYAPPYRTGPVLRPSDSAG